MNTKVMYSSREDEWYTPHWLVSKVTTALGGVIELDPCSNEVANRVVSSKRFFTPEQDGLAQEWGAETLFINPPYGRGIGKWVRKLVTSINSGRVKRAIALLPNRTDTAWLALLREYPRCHVLGRVAPSWVAPFPSVAVALNCNFYSFYSEFRSVGEIYVHYDPAGGVFAIPKASHMILTDPPIIVSEDGTERRLP